MNQRFRFCTLRAAAILVVTLKALVSAIAAPSPQVVPIYPNTNEFTYVGRHLDLKSWHITDGGVFYPDVPSDIGTTIHPAQALYANTLIYMDGPTWSSGTGSPEGFRIAPPGSIYSGKDGGSGTSFYIKESGTGDTGWVPISPVGGLITTNYTILGGVNITVTTVTDGTDVSFTIDGIQGDSLWRTNASGIYFPLISTTATVVIGQSADAWWSPSFTDGLLSVHNTDAGDSEFNTLVVGAIDNVVMENSAYLEVLLHSGVLPQANLQFRSFTNWQNPSAPIQEFSVDLQAALGQVLVKLNNNGIIEFAVSNQVTSVMGLQLTPLDNALLSLGPNNVNVASNSFVRLAATLADPTTTEVDLSAGVRDGMLLLLQNVGTNTGFTLYNGSPLYDDPAHFVTLQNGDWATDDYGDGLLLIGGVTGWAEVARFTQNTNTVTGDLLWELVGGVMRTVPANPDRFDFRYGGVPQLTVTTNGALRFGPGDTNILYRFDTDLAYTNGTQYPSLFIYGADGVPAQYGLQATVGGTAAQVAGDKGVNLGWGSTQLALYSTNGVPSIPLNWGTVGKPFWNLQMEGTHYIYGYNALNDIDYSRLALSQSGSNAPIVFDSQSAGNAGDPGGFLFQTNGTTVASIAATSGYDGTGTHFLSDDGTYKAGSSGTTINPTDGFLPYRTSGTSFGNSPIYRTGASYITVAPNQPAAGLAVGTNLFVIQGSGPFAGNEADAYLYSTIDNFAGTYSRVNFHTATNIAQISLLSATTGDSSHNTLWNIYSAKTATTGLEIQGVYNGTAAVDILPSAATTPSIPGTPFYFNAVNVQTNETIKLFAVKNASTNLFAVNNHGPIELAGITKAEKALITATNGMVVYQTDNTPGLRAYVNGAWVMVSTVADP